MPAAMRARRAPGPPTPGSAALRAGHRRLTGRGVVVDHAHLETVGGVLEGDHRLVVEVAARVGEAVQVAGGERRGRVGLRVGHGEADGRERPARLPGAAPAGLDERVRARRARTAGRRRPGSAGRASTRSDSGSRKRPRACGNSTSRGRAPAAANGLWRRRRARRSPRASPRRRTVPAAARDEQVVAAQDRVAPRRADRVGRVGGLLGRSGRRGQEPGGRGQRGDQLPPAQCGLASGRWCSRCSGQRRGRGEHGRGAGAPTLSVSCAARQMSVRGALALTEYTGGRRVAAANQLAPASPEPKTSPDVAPK